VVEGVVSTTSSYIVVITNLSGESSIYQAGTYLDELVQQDGEWRYRSKRVVYDTLRVATLLATPI
jgi:anthranilate 1,2-dioxygenase small subunit